MSRTPLAFLAVLFAVALGCTPTPQQTCEKMQKLADDDSSKPGKKPFVLSMSKCLEQMNEMKARDAEAYKCTAKLVSKLSNLDTVFIAIGVCDKNRPKKTADDETDDAPKKKKKKSSDDDE